MAVTNTSTFQNAYPSSEIQGMFQQTFDIATQGIPGIQDGEVVKDKEWSVCLACAVVDRARRSVGVPRSGVCESCLKRYCWS